MSNQTLYSILVQIHLPLDYMKFDARFVPCYIQYIPCFAVCIFICDKVFQCWLAKEVLLKQFVRVRMCAGAGYFSVVH